MTNNPGFKSSFTYKLLLWIVLCSTVLGQLLKVLHYPGAALLLVISTICFTLFFLPYYVLEVWQTRSGFKSKLLLLLQNLVLFLFSLGFLFKNLHLAGSGFLFYLNHIVLLLVVAPFAIYHIIKSLKQSSTRPYHYLILVYFFTLCLGALFNSGAGKVNVKLLLPQVTQKERLVTSTTNRNQLLYQQIEAGSFGDVGAATQQKLTQLRNYSASCIRVITSTRRNLLMSCEDLPEKTADTITATQLVSRSSTDETNAFLIGSQFKPKNDIYSANALKLAIQQYRDSLLQLVENSDRLLISKSINLSTDNYIEPESGDIVLWELINFFDQPMLSILQQLAALQYEVLHAEYQVQTQLLRAAQATQNVATMQKLERLEQEKEVLKLKEDNRRGLELLNSKKLEIDDMGSAIFIFVLSSLLFVAMIFFTLRSNLLRKKANKQLQLQKEIIGQQKTEVESQKHLIEEKQKEILDSISYAKRLQTATLPSEAFMRKHLPEMFLLYLPKDIVAGDFYWADHKNDTFYVAAADSTGHGVPGAMVSMVCANALNRALHEFNCKLPGHILDKTRELVTEAFAKNNNDVKDGMDISLLAINHSAKTVQWSGANNPLWYIQNGSLNEIKANKQAIGKTDNASNFISHDVPYAIDNIYYLFTDGFADQFGGPAGKKFKYKQLQELLLNLNTTSIEEQKALLQATFSSWKGTLEQVDDICVIGLKLPQ